jgi:hypothetical protein
MPKGFQSLLLPSFECGDLGEGKCEENISGSTQTDSDKRNLLLEEKEIPAESLHMPEEEKEPEKLDIVQRMDSLYVNKEEDINFKENIIEKVSVCSDDRTQKRKNRFKFKGSPVTMKKNILDISFIKRNDRFDVRSENINNTNRKKLKSCFKNDVIKISKDPLMSLEVQPVEQRLALRKPEPVKVTDFKYYEVDDEILGKIIYKSEVIQSSQKLSENLVNYLQPQINYEMIADLQKFNWDNYEAYYKRQAKVAAKNAIIKKVSFIDILNKYLHDHIVTKLTYQRLSKATVVFLLALLLQLIISRRARHWSLSILQIITLITTSIGAGGSIFLLVKKYKSLKN